MENQNKLETEKFTNSYVYLENGGLNKKLGEDIMKRYKKYVNDESYVYKLCHDISRGSKECEWIVVMQKTEKTKTNEDRKNITNKNYAKFRASTLKVIEIFSVNYPSYTVKKIVTNFWGRITRYEVGKSVEPNKFDENINNVCSEGIHYFKTIIPAYYYRSVPDEYAGYWISHYDDGSKESEGYYEEGVKWSFWTHWNENGTIDSKGQYIKGQRNKKWTHYHENGKIKTCGEYNNDEKNGYWISFHSNEQKESEGNYINDQKSGHWVFWNDKGEKETDGEYLEGKRIGTWEIYDGLLKENV